MCTVELVRKLFQDCGVFKRVLNLELCPMGKDYSFSNTSGLSDVEKMLCTYM